MSGRRASEVGMNFDGLTDVTTNLAAGLILLIIITLNITTPRPKQVGPSEGDAPTAGVVDDDPPPPDEAGPKSIAPLLERVEELRGGIALMDQAIRDRAAEVDDLRKQIEQLRSGVKPTPGTDTKPSTRPPSPPVDRTTVLIEQNAGSS